MPDSTLWPAIPSLDEKRRVLLSQLLAIADGQERLAFLVDLTGKRARLPDELKLDAFRVEGCLSKLWLVPAWREGRCWFQCDSDSIIVKAIAGLLCDLYSGHTPQEILGQDPDFLGQAGINQHLSMNRRNGLGRVWSLIRSFAQSHYPGEIAAA